MSVDDVSELLEDRNEIFSKTGKTLEGFTKKEIMDEIQRCYKSTKKPWNTFSQKDLDYYYTHYGNAAEYRLCKSKPKLYAANLQVIKSAENIKTGGASNAGQRNITRNE